VAGPPHDEIPGGNANPVDISNSEVFFDCGDWRMKTIWKNLYDMGDCEEI
jgi:hypothetical protein